MHRQTFKTTLSEGGGKESISATMIVFPFPVRKKQARVFGLSQLVLSGVVACSVLTGKILVSFFEPHASSITSIYKANDTGKTYVPKSY